MPYGTTDPKYCSKFHKCGSKYQACPKVPYSVRHQTECYTPKVGVFSCLNRMDKYPDFFNQSLYQEEPLNLNKLPFEFNKTHLRCQENKWFRWKIRALKYLVYTKSCQSKRGKEVAGRILYNLITRDMGFKGRHLIPKYHLKE